MILIRTQFIFISLARFCIWHTVVLELTIELVRIFDTIKRAKASGSFHCCLLVRKIWYLCRHLLVETVRCLKLAWRVPTHTVNLFSLVCCSCIHCWTCPHLFVNINRAKSWFLHCYLLLEKSVSVSSSSIERQVLSLEKLVLVVSLFARWNHCPFPRTWLACEYRYVHCRL